MMTIFLFISPDAVGTTGEIAAKSRPVSRPEAKTEMQITRIRSRLLWCPPRAGARFDAHKGRRQDEAVGILQIVNGSRTAEKSRIPGLWQQAGAGPAGGSTRPESRWPCAAAPLRARCLPTAQNQKACSAGQPAAAACSCRWRRQCPGLPNPRRSSV